MTTNKAKITTSHITRDVELKGAARTKLKKAVQKFVAATVKANKLKSLKSADLATKPVLVAIPLELLALPHYQDLRTPGDVPHVRRIYAEFDPLRFHPIIVNFRDGLLWVLDGHHRLEVAHIMGMDCIMAFLLNVDEDTETMMFADQHMNKKNLSLVVTYKSHLDIKNADAQGDEVVAHQTIHKALLAHRLDVGSVAKPGIVTPGAIQNAILNGNKGEKKLVTNYEYKLEWVLSALTDTKFAFTPNGTIGHVVNGVIRCYNEAARRGDRPMDEYLEALKEALVEFEGGNELKAYVHNVDPACVLTTHGKTSEDGYQRIVYAHVLKSAMLDHLP